MEAPGRSAIRDRLRAETLGAMERAVAGPRTTAGASRASTAACPWTRRGTWRKSRALSRVGLSSRLEEMTEAVEDKEHPGSDEARGDVRAFRLVQRRQPLEDGRGRHASDRFGRVPS